MEMLDSTGYSTSGLKGSHKGRATRSTSSKLSTSAHLLLLASLTLVVYYTKRASYFGTSWSIHDQYLNLPPLRPVTKAERKGGWNFTADVYDRATKHPNANILNAGNPRVIHFPSFMTVREADHLVSIAKKDLHRSQVVADDKDRQTSTARTSYGMWPKRDNFMYMIEERIHRLVGIPHEFGEGMYVLNYKQGQEYKAHNDNCKGRFKEMAISDSCEDFLKRAGGPECGPKKGGPACGDRIATFIIVLDPAEEGGNTAFPRADITLANMAGISYQDDGSIPWYCSAKYKDKVLQASANKGDGILFWDYMPNEQDPSDALEVDGSQHSGCPVLKGEKWIVTRWIRSAEFI
jgi:prolyl 4-hydroxylase